MSRVLGIIQHLPQLGCQVLLFEWLVNKMNPLIQYAMASNHVGSKPDMNRHFRFGLESNSFSAKSRPLISGMTTSVMSKSILLEYDSLILMA